MRIAYYTPMYSSAQTEIDHTTCIMQIVSKRELRFKRWDHSKSRLKCAMYSAEATELPSD